MRKHGCQMQEAGIFPGDVLAVDRALTPASGQVVVAQVGGELVVRRFVRHSSGQCSLVADDSDVAPIRLDEESDARIWGVVTYAVHRVGAR